MPSTFDTRIVGRDSELSAIVGFLDSVDRSPGGIMLEGEAGAGKTRLLEAAIQIASERGFHVLECRPARQERRLSYVALRDLLDDEYDVVAPHLPEPQQQALAAALLRIRPRRRREAAAVAAAFTNALRRLARQSPVLVAIDDVQWLDPASEAVLRFALRRLDGEPVALVATRRAGDGDEAGSDPLLPAERTVQLTVGPLAMGAIHVLIRNRLDLSLPRPTLRRLHETTGGNPFFALEIARAIQRREGDVTGARLPVPATLRELVRDRLSRLSNPARVLLPPIACLARPTVEVLRSIHSSSGSVEDAIAESVAAGVLRIEDGRIGFTHPLLAAHVEGELTPLERRNMHRELAELVSDAEERARHLALATELPDERTAALMDKAAEAAFARGAPDAAGDLVAEARRLTPAHHQADLLTRTVRMARFRFEAGDAARANTLLQEVIDGPSPGNVRAEARSALARVHFFTGRVHTAVELFEAALPEAAESVRADAEDGLTWSLILLRQDTRAARRHGRAAFEAYTRLGEPDRAAEALSGRAFAEFLIGRPSGRRLMDQAVAQAVPIAAIDHPRVVRHPAFNQAILFLNVDWSTQAADLFRQLLQKATERGDESSRARILLGLSYGYLLTGDWDAARRFAEEGHDAAVQAGQQPQFGMVLHSKAVLEAHLGTGDALKAHSGIEVPDETEAPVEAMIGRYARGLSALSAGRAADAHDSLAPLVERVRAAGIREPGAMRFVVDDMEALLELGDFADGEALLDWYEGCARVTRRASALAACARVRGLVASARRDNETAAQAFERALRHHDRAPFPFDRARTLLALGVTQRRAGKKRAARDSLEGSIGIFRALGATEWTAKAEREVARIGGKRASPGQLTPTERRIATLVAQGRSNKEVAAALFVTVKTVEAALSRVYAKLGVASRSALAHRLQSIGEVSTGKL